MQIKDYLKEKPLTDFHQSLEKFITYINGLDINLDATTRFAKIKEFWKRDFGFFIFLAMRLNLSPCNYFYRVRIDTGDINRELIQEFGPPPINFSKSFQRANIPAYPVFYAGLSMDVAVFETMHQLENVNKHFYLSKWKVKHDIETIATSFLFKETVQSDLNEAVQHLSYSTEHIFKGLTVDEKTFVNKYLEVIINEFLNPESYMLSSYVGHEHLYAKHNCPSDILYYPSIRKKHNGINVAIHPSFANQNLELDTVYYCRNNETTKTNIPATFFHIGKVNGNKIIWNNITNEDFESVKKEYNT